MMFSQNAACLSEQRAYSKDAMWWIPSETVRGWYVEYKCKRQEKKQVCTLRLQYLPYSYDHSSLPLSENNNKDFQLFSGFILIPSAMLEKKMVYGACLTKGATTTLSKIILI